MATAHRTEAVTVGELLGGGRLLGVPLYQRDYAWTWREVDQLLADLFDEHQAMADAPEEDRSYYLGLIIIIDNTPQRLAMARFRRGVQAPSEVVDGKQRLTTLTMMIAVLRDLLGPAGGWLETYLTETSGKRPWPKHTPRLLLEENEQDYLVSHILPPGSTLNRTQKDLSHESVRRMAGVRDHIRSMLKSRDAAFLASFAEMLVTRCDLTAIIPKDISLGFKMFVTVNFRGKSLSANDIVKAELIGAMEPAARGELNKRWNALRDRLEPSPDDPKLAKRAASLDNLLSHVHKLRCKPSTAVFRGITELAASAPNPLFFVTDTLEPLAHIMLAVKRATHSGSPISDNLNRILTTLNWLPSNDWVPAAMAALDTHARAPDKALECIGLLQRLAYAQAILGRGNDLRERRYRRAIQAILEGASLKAPGGPFVIDEEECGQLAHFMTSNLYRTKGGHCKSVLAWISMLGSNSDSIGPLKGYTVEHLLPRSPSTNPYWQKQFPNDAIREACVRSLGNLALVTERQNGRVKNSSYPDKLAILFGRDEPSPFDTTRMLQSIGDWTPQAVLARETLMFERVAKAWGLEPRGRSKLAALLKT
jgi:hypothetical protein